MAGGAHVRPKPSEAIYHTISMLEEVDELLSSGEVDMVEDGPSPGPRSHIGEPVDVVR